MNLVDRFEIEVVDGEEDDVLIDFKQYLTRITNEMSDSIVEKMKDYNALKSRLEDLLVRYTGKIRHERKICFRFYFTWR